MLTITNQMILDQIPGSVAWKDHNLKYIGANNNLLNSMNLKHLQDIIGLDDRELSLVTPQMIELFQQQDLLVLNGQSLEVIHGLENTKEDKTYLLQKKPLCDNNNKIIGVIFHCTPWSQSNLLTSLQQIDKKFQSAADVPDHYAFESQLNPAQLSNRELECLFLQLRGKTAKQIAEILQLSKRTVEYYIENMKSKFGCLNKSELLMTAMKNGYHQNIPKSLLKFNLVELLSR